MKKENEEPELDSEDEEIVFVGRNGQMNDMPPSPQTKHDSNANDLERDRLVFDSLVNDQGASFGYVSMARRILIDAMLMTPDAGWSTRSHRITAYTLGLLLWVIQRAVKPMLAFRIEALTDLSRLFLELALFGAWSD